MCDWCNDSIPANTSVTDISGSLKYCSVLCLNKYKMNLFCMEAQQHLPQLQKEMTGQVNYVSTDKKMLITPDLWLSEGNTCDFGHHKFRKCHKVGKDLQSKFHSSNNATPVLKLHDKFEHSYQEYSRNNISPRPPTNPRKKHKVDSTSENGGKNTKDTHHDRHKFQQIESLVLKTSSSSEVNPKIMHATAGQTDQHRYIGQSSNFPYLFLHPWLNPPITTPNLSSFIFSNAQNQNLNFPNHHHQNIPHSSSNNMMNCPIILPIPIPIPIPIIISKDPSKDAKLNPLPGDLHKHKFPQAQDIKECSPDRAIDFSFRKVSRNITDQSHDLQQQNESNAPPAPQMLVYTIKTEPEEPHQVQPPTNAFTGSSKTRTSYAERRSLILDAPPPIKASTSHHCLQAPRRLSQHRKKCYSVHIKTK